MNAPLGQETSLAGRISADWTTLSAAERIRSIAATQSDGLVATSSFGAQSAIMLHLLKENAPEIPIIFIDTGYLFPETYQFALDKPGVRGMCTPAVRIERPRTTTIRFLRKSAI